MKAGAAGEMELEWRWSGNGKVLRRSAGQSTINKIKAFLYRLTHLNMCGGVPYISRVLEARKNRVDIDRMQRGWPDEQEMLDLFVCTAYTARHWLSSLPASGNARHGT